MRRFQHFVVVMTTVIAATSATTLAASQSIGPSGAVGELSARAIPIPLLYLLGNAAAALLITVLLLRWRALQLRPGVVPLPRAAPLLGVGFVTLAVAQILGASIVIRVIGPVTLESPLRSHALVMLGSYATQLPIAIALLLALPKAPHGVLWNAALGGLGLVLVWPFLQFASLAAGTVQELLTDAPTSHLGHRTLQQLAESQDPAWSIVVASCVVFIGPMLEEIAYRGALQGALRAIGLGPWTAIALTSVVFASVHINALPDESVAAGLSALFVFSIGLGIMRERSRSLLPCIMAHGLFNAANLIIAMVQR